MSDWLTNLSKVLEAKTPQPVLGVEGEDARVDARYVLAANMATLADVALECSRMTVSNKSTKDLFSTSTMKISLIV